MIDHLAIATVTATLVDLLRGPVQTAVAGATVWPDRPPGEDAVPVDPEARVFLYSVQPSAVARNSIQPDLAFVALDLDYLLTFYGDERAFEPQRMLGSVLRELHARPVLGRDVIRRMVAAGVAADPAFPLAKAGFVDQPELVRLRQLTLGPADMAMLWSSFFRSAYRLSVACRASVVLASTADAPEPT